VTPTPPVNGRAKFVRHNGRRSLTESLPQPNRTSPALSIDVFSRTTNHLNNSSIMSNRYDNNENEDDEEMNQHRYRPPSSTTNISLAAPPVKPRKSSTTPSSSLINTSKRQQSRHQRHHVVVTSAHSEDDDDNEEHNSLEGHGGQSDFDDDDQSPSHERPNSRLSVRDNDDRVQQQSNATLRRPHHKQAKQVNRHSMYDDYRFLDEQQQQQQQQPASFIKSKHQNRSTTNKEFPLPSPNRIGSSSGNQSATNRLKSGSKSSSNESMPALDLTVAGQKLFRTKQQVDTYHTNSLPPASTIRPPSGRLKPINSAKSTSSYTDELSSTSSKTLEDVTNNVKQTSPKAHLYKKRLAPLINSNDIINKRISYRSSIEQQSYTVDDVPSDRSEETSGGTNTGGAGGRDIRSSSGSDKRSKYH
jgi:hypothetical protein